ncbi:MAG: Smr/MutS family protein [Nitrospinae bacterium]|nr:Smr/MutS family protein [Nitrospinota bacterium]
MERKKQGVVTVNLKEGMPTVEEARQKLKAELARSRDRGVKVVKLIHGYGSTGVGGAIKVAIRKSLALRKKEGAIRLFVPGERFNDWDAEAVALFAVMPGMKGDPDYQRGNEGITFVLL